MPPWKNKIKTLKKKKGKGVWLLPTSTASSAEPGGRRLSRATWFSEGTRRGEEKAVGAPRSTHALPACGVSDGGRLSPVWESGRLAKGGPSAVSKELAGTVKRKEELQTCNRSTRVPGRCEKALCGMAGGCTGHRGRQTSASVGLWEGEPGSFLVKGGWTHSADPSRTGTDRFN